MKKNYSFIFLSVLIIYAVFFNCQLDSNNGDSSNSNDRFGESSSSSVSSSSNSSDSSSISSVSNSSSSSIASSFSSSSSSSLSAGDRKMYTVNGVSFNVIYVPGKSFKTGTDDSSTATVNDPYWIAETETTYELWNKVLTWAVSNGYIFADSGIMGDGSGDTNQHPVTTINWRDAMVWTNALTEWYNANTGSKLTTVYNDGGSPIRDSTNANVCDNAVPDTSATGFRLLTSNEWELAARYISDNNGDGYISDTGEYYPGDHASGDTTGYCYPSDGKTSTVFGDYAWYSGNSGSSTHEVKTTLPNALGIYDMSGNVYEWNFDLALANRVVHSGSWLNDQDRLQVGDVGSFASNFLFYSIGFRIGINK